MADETGSDAGPAGTESVVPDATAPFDVMVEQGLTGVTDAELRGEEVPDEEVKPEDLAKPPVDEVKPVEKPAETLPPKVEPPPKGFVPLKAVQEVREENRALKERLKAIEAKLDPEVKVAPVTIPEVRADFKVLSRDELKELTEESPRDAVLYMAELRDFEIAQRMTAEAKDAEAKRSVEVANLFSESVKLMEAAVPDIFTEGSTAQQDLADFAETIGFTKDMFYLTNPETMIILPGETEPVYLGSQAASFIKMLADLRNKKPGDVPAADQTALRKTIEAELRATIEAEVLSKIKTGVGKPAFKSMGDIPSSDAETPSSQKMLTEAQVSKLSPAALKAYLSGE